MARRPGRGGWGGAGLASRGVQFTCPVSGFVYPLILQAWFSLPHACLSALPPAHRRAGAGETPPTPVQVCTWGREGTMPRGSQCLCCPCWDLLARESPSGTANAPIRSVSPPNCMFHICLVPKIAILQCLGRCVKACLEATLHGEENLLVLPHRKPRVVCGCLTLMGA